MLTVLGTRDQIIMDLHTYYRNQGLQESQITVKTANLLLLLPKIEVGGGAREGSFVGRRG